MGEGGGWTGEEAEGLPATPAAAGARPFARLAPAAPLPAADCAAAATLPPPPPPLPAGPPLLLLPLRAAAGCCNKVSRPTSSRAVGRAAGSGAMHCTAQRSTAWQGGTG